ncbi:RNA-directed DNA polymerase, eukaryota, partial [Tanacetum coccineum]
MDGISHMDVKSLWGNSYIWFCCSESFREFWLVFLYWVASIFRKMAAIFLDNFIAIYGTWLPRNVKILLVAVYAPQQPRSKRALWDFLSNLVRRWNGEAIIMGDFNDVSDYGMKRLLEGYSFTWSHPSASKMSKLDRFLVTEVPLMDFRPISLMDALLRWIRGTFTSSMASILVNGSPTSEFPFCCGLKQGDPLAPYLFILIMESLHISFSRVVDDGLFKGSQKGVDDYGIYLIVKFFHVLILRIEKISWVAWENVLASKTDTTWVKFIPIKVNVFSWRARRDRLPTRVNLSRRGVLLDSHLCPLCNAAMEDVQHVFFRCDVARVVLRKICRWWDLDWQEICSFSDWDAWFLSFRLSSRLKSILEGVFYVAWWRIWRLRNQLVFDASPPNRSTIFDDI